MFLQPQQFLRIGARLKSIVLWPGARFLELERCGFKSRPILLANCVTSGTWLYFSEPRCLRYTVELIVFILAFYEICLKDILIFIQLKRDLMVKYIWKTLWTLFLYFGFDTAYCQIKVPEKFWREKTCLTLFNPKCQNIFEFMSSFSFLL